MLMNQRPGGVPVLSVCMQKPTAGRSGGSLEISSGGFRTWRTFQALNMVLVCVEINQCVGCTRQFFTKSFLGDDAAVLAPSSGEEP